MKKLLSLLVLLGMIYAPAHACLSCPEWEGETSFVIVRPFSNSETEFPNAMFHETVDFWHKYVGKRVSRETVANYFDNASSDNLATDLKNDDFLRLLNQDAFAMKYLSICLKVQDGCGETWDYEKGERLISEAYNEMKTLTQVPASFEYRVTLLRMRLYKIRKEYFKIEQLWQTKGKNCQDAALRKRLEGYYASALYANGKYKEALKVYTTIGDPCSANMCITQFAGFEGLSKLALEGANENDQTLYYAMQDYANFYWNTKNRYHYYLEEEETLNNNSAANKDAERVKLLCRNHVNDKDKAMWLNLLAWLEMCDKNYSQAMSLAEEAVYAKSTAMARENAQRILFLARVKSAHMLTDENELKQITADYQELLSRARKELVVPGQYSEDSHYSSFYSEKYRHQNINYCFMRDTYMDALKEYFDTHKLAVARTCAIMLLEKAESEGNAVAYENTEEASFMNTVWGSEWFSHLDNEATPDQLFTFMNSLKTGKSDDHFMRNTVGKWEEPIMALNDLIGTKLMRNGKYEEALPFLQALTPQYIRSTHYQYYLSTRSYKAAAPFWRTQYNDDPWDEEGKQVNAENYKAKFCQKVISDTKRLQTLNGETKAKAELELAGRLFQASYYGDLWPLSRFSWSSYHGENEEDDTFCLQAQDLLQKALADCTTSATRLNAYYGLASVLHANNHFWQLSYNWETNVETYEFQSYHPATAAYDYLAKHRNESKIVAGCDVIKWYARRLKIEN